MTKIGIKHTNQEMDWCLPEDEITHEKDTGNKLPVLVQGAEEPIGKFNSVTVRIIEGECDRCGYDRIKKTTDDAVNKIIKSCNACGAIQKDNIEKGWVMKDEKSERIENEENVGVLIAELCGYDVYDLEPSTNNPYISLIDGLSITRINKNCVNRIENEL